MADRTVRWRTIIGWGLFALVLGFIAWVGTRISWLAILAYEEGGYDGLSIFIAGCIMTLMVVYMAREAFKVGETL